MNKKEFIDKLEKRLSNIDQIEREKTLQYYEESISDRMEDGLSEEEAVAALGDINDIISNIMCEKSLISLVKTKVGEMKGNSKSNTTWMLFVILGFPLWFPLVTVFAVTAFVIYLAIALVMLSFIIVIIAFGACSIAALFTCFIKFATSGFAAGGIILGISFITGGLAIVLFEPCKEAAKKMGRGTLFFIKKIKTLFLPKKEA